MQEVPAQDPWSESDPRVTNMAMVSPAEIGGPAQVAHPGPVERRGANRPR